MTEQGNVWTWADTLDAMKEGVSGLEVSRKKWRATKHILNLLARHVKSRCGLCEESGSNLISCTNCSLARRWGITCLNPNSKFAQVMKAIREAYMGCLDMLDELNELEILDAKKKALDTKKKEIETLEGQKKVLETRIKELKEVKLQKADVIVGDIFYNRTSNKFFEIRSIHTFSYKTGGFAHFYDDAKTNTCHDVVCYEYLRDLCIKVTDLRAHPEFWHRDSIGWRVRER